MNKKGFTLVELLAVIVVLGIIMTIAGSAVLTQKKKANQGEVVAIYNDIKTFGPDVYLKEKDSINGKVYFNVEYLKNEGYLKSDIKNPANPKNDCEAYLLIDKSSDNMFEAYVECEGLTHEGTNPIDNGYAPFQK